MTHTICHVVGDRFTEFAKNPNVVTISGLLTALSEGGPRHDDGTRFIAGQGLQEELVHALLSTAERTGRLHQFSLWRKPPPVDGRLSHKNDPRNTLITRPERIEEDLYRSYFFCDERVEVLADHITGQHLPGMVLVEAARQLYMAVYEEYFSAPEQGKSSFALTVLNNSFSTYVFPTEIELQMRIVEKDTKRADRISLRAVTRALQAGRSAFEQELNATVIPQPVLSAVEAKRAQQTLTAIQAAKEGRDSHAAA